MKCPLCNASADYFIFAFLHDWFQCSQCTLRFVPPAQHPPPKIEKARYDTHRNDPADSGYVSFLKRLYQPLSERLEPGARGLDYGSGPAPVLSRIFTDAGYPCKNYDYFYAPKSELLFGQYDFLTCSETIEHFFRPREEFERFLTLVRPGGWIGIMTQLYDEADRPFDQWYYANDVTHVCIFSLATFQWLEKRYGLAAEYHPHGVILLKKPAAEICP